MNSSDNAAPPLPLLLREMGAFVAMRLKATFAPAVGTGIVGDGRTVIVIPGFMASDTTTSRLRRSLQHAGFDVHGWGLGRNRGVKADILQRMSGQVAPLAANAPVTLVGWSLGGLLAREYAKFAPGDVAKVVTLGSPFSGSLRANNAWRIYELIARHRIDAPPISTTLNEKPPAETVAIWSGRDGVVAPGSARGERNEADRTIELDCSHMAFVADPVAIRSICQAIAS